MINLNCDSARLLSAKKFLRLGKLLSAGFVFVTCLALALFVQPATAQQNAEEPLTNAAVVKLVRAGFKEKTVVAIIRSRPGRFDLGPDRLIDLKRSGVSERIILTMIGQDDSEFMSDDYGFENSRAEGGGSAANKGTQRDEGGDIFGSSGSSRSQRGGRGESGANEGNSVTTGSATVHILRPPTEAGAIPKLERTPTLTNEAIIEMVDAGFSEGTIIRRIEHSPADFNLSSTQFSELHKHRVSAPVIAAMKAAMGDDPIPARSPAANNPEK